MPAKPAMPAALGTPAGPAVPPMVAEAAASARPAAPARPARAATVAVLAAAVAGLMSAGVAPVHAQGLNLQVVPKIGVYSPLSSFGADSELESTLAYGVAGELLLPGLPLNVRLNLDHASTTNIVRRDATESVLGTASITAVVGDIVLRPFLATARFQPYLLAGAGAKFYSIDRDAQLPELGGVGDRATRATLHVGGGVDVQFGPLAVLLEVGNYLSTLAARTDDSRLQHDAFGLLGFRVSMF